MSATRKLVSSVHRFPGTLRPIAAAILTLMGSSAYAATDGWVGASGGYWDVAGNWNGGTAPGTGDTVSTGGANTIFRTGTVSIGSLTGTGNLTVSGGILQIEGASSIGSLTLANTSGAGYLGGAGTLTTGSFNFTGGSIGYTGRTGTITVTGMTTFDASGANQININETLNLNGGATWAASSTGYVNINSGNYGGQVNIGAGATFSDLGNLAAGQSRYFGASSQGSVVNNGTYTRSGLGTTYIQAQFTNSGVVNVNGGTLSLGGSSGGYGSGTWNVASGATLQLGSGSSSIYGTINNSGTLTSSGNAYLSLQTYTGGGSLAVTGGTFTLQSYGATIAPGSLSVSGGTADFNSAVNAGTVTLSGNAILGGYGTVTAGTLNFGAGTMGDCCVAGTTTVTGAANIDGALAQSITSGRTLNLNGSSTWSAATNGAINIASSGKVVVGSGATFADYGTTGGGTRQLGGTGNTGTFTNQGTYNRTGLGTTQVGVAFNNNGVLNVNGGTMSIGAGGSSLGQWNVASGATLTFSGGSSDVHGGTLNNAGGTVAVTGGGTVSVSGGGTSTGAISTAAGGTLNISGGAYAVTGGTLTNAGTLIVSAGSLNVASNVNFSGAGTVAVSGGQLNSTAFANLAGGTMNVSGGTVNLYTGATMANLSISGGSVVQQYVGGGYANSVTVGTLSFTGGSMLNSQAVGFQTTVAGAATFGSGSETLSNGQRLTLNGASTWAAGDGSKIAIVGGSGSQAQLNIGSAGTFADLGNGARTLGGDGFSYVYNAGAYTRTGSGTTTATNSFTNTGTLNVNGGTMAFAAGNDVFSGHSSSGTINIGSAGTMQDDAKFTVSAGTVNNQGTLKVNAGTTTLAAGVAYSGNGAINVTGGALVSAITGAITTGGIALTGGATSFVGAVNASSLSLAGGTLTAASNVTVATDYANTGFGSGNGFNKRAGVSGAGLINGTNVAEAITGAAVTNGTTGNATLTIGNVRVGTANSYAYQVANTGTGSTLRGAIQTTGTGIGVNDARLTGTGVTAGNFGPLAAGTNSGDLAVGFTASTAGAIVLNGVNTIHVANNFGNVAEQNLSIVAGSGAAAYNVAAGSATVALNNSLGNVRVGTALSGGINVTNTAASGSYSEDLNASIVATSGATASGSLTGVRAGQSNGSALVATLDSGTAGAKTGSVTIGYTTAGKVAGVSNGLGTLAVGSQAVAVSGGVYNYAVGSIAPAPLVVANQRVGGTNTAAVVVSNTADSGAYSEALNASINGVTGSAITNGGSFTNLIAGGANAAAIGVGVGTATSGAKSGTVTIGYQSDGTGSNGNSGLAAIAAGTQTVNVSGSVYDVAVGSITTTPVVLANQRVGGSASSALTVANTAATGGYSEALNASIGGATGGATTNNGSFANLAAGAANGSALRVGIATGNAGLISGTATVGFKTDGTGSNGNSGLAAIAAGSQTVSVSGSVYNTAVGSIASAPVVIASQRIGGAGTSSVTVSNTAATGSYSEALNANVTGTSGGGVGSGSVSNLAAGSAVGNAINVGVNTATAGLKSGTVTVGYQTDGTGSNGNSGLAAIGAGSQTVAVSGAVYRLASPTTTTGAIVAVARVGDVAQGSFVGITNSSPDVYTEGLSVTRGATAAGFTASGAISNLSAGASSNAIGVKLDTSTAGTFHGSQTLDYVSTGAGTTGAADLAIGSGSVTLDGKVYATAVAAAASAVDFGIVHVGDVAARGVSVMNAAVGALTDVLTGSAKGASAAFSASGNLGGGVAAGSSSSALTVGMDTSTSGVHSGTAAFSLASHNADLSDAALADLALSLTGTVDNYAADAFSFDGGAGTFSQVGSTYYLDYGTVIQGSGKQVTSLLAGNSATGLADLLDGTFDLTDADDFGESGFASFTNFGAGQYGGPLKFSFDALALGEFTDTITLHGLGHNASGYSAALGDLKLIVRGSVIAGAAAPAPSVSGVPEPDAWMLIGLGIPLILVWRRRRSASTTHRQGVLPR